MPHVCAHCCCLVGPLPSLPVCCSQRLQVKTSIPGFYNAFKNKLRNLQQGCDTTIWLCLQDGDKLEPGGFYLDRHPQAKHLPLAGTKYGSADVDRLWAALEGMAAPALPARTVAAS